MADETPNTATLAPESSDEVSAVPNLPPPTTDKESSPPPPQPPPQPQPAEPLFEKPAKSSHTLEEVIESEKPKPIETQKLPPQSLISFKEESNLESDLSDSEKKAFHDLKQLLQEALNNHVFTSPPPPPSQPTKEEEPKPSPTEVQTTQEIPPSVSTEPTTETPPAPPPPKETENVKTAIESTVEPPKEIEEITTTPDEVSIWGIPLLKDDRSDVILLKFLRARDFKVKDAFTMIKNTVQWRKEFGIDALLDENLGDDLEKVVFMHGFDRDGHPVCYNVYGEFQNKELYQQTFSDEEKRMKFLRWRIQFLERSIRKLDFSPGGVSTIFQVNDLKNSPGPGKRELRQATKQALQLLQDNYPEFVAKQVFINVPWWYIAFYTMISPFMTQRTKSKFVFTGPSKSADTLFKYISPEQVPIQYGGLSVDFCDCNPEFSIDDPATEITVKPATKQTVEILVSEKCVIVWEIRVVGWEVSYSAEYIPSDKEGYTVIIHKATKMAPTDEPVVCNNFKIIEIGKIMLTIDNPTSKKKKLLYRFKVKPLYD